MVDKIKKVTTQGNVPINKAIYLPDDKLIFMLNNYFKSNSVRYTDFCKMSINARFDEDGNIIGDSGSSVHQDIPSLIQDIVSIYSDRGLLCYIVDSNDIITGVTWNINIRWVELTTNF